MTKLYERLGNYHLLCPIGSGGFATVYLGEHIYLKTRAAIKVLQVGSELDSSALQGFLEEARIIAALKHPHIVSILDFNVEGNLPYLVMDYAPHGSLYARHVRDQTLSIKMVLSYVKQVAEALQFAHKHKVIHCDIKPANMLLDEHDRVLLSDFGIAVVLNTSLHITRVIGSLQYMAPEQFQGKPERASDQYALAVVAYQWLCGRLPFNGKGAGELTHQHIKVPPYPLHLLNSKISHKVEQVILTALAKDPKQRFSSINTFVNALEEAAYHQAGNSQDKARIHFPPVAAKKNAKPLKKEQSSALSETPLLLPPSFSLLPPIDEEQLAVPSQSQMATVPYNFEEEDGWEPTQVVSTPMDRHMIPSPVQSLLSQQATTLPLAPSPQTLPVSHPSLIYNGHTAWISSVAWSPDRKRIASASWDKTVHLWDRSNGKTLLIYQEHLQPVKSVAWSPDGAYIASGSWDNRVHIWDAEEGKTFPTGYYHDAQVESVAWSPDGRFIASAGHDGIVHIWKATNGRAIFTYKGHREPIWSATWSPDGKFVASASHDGTVHVWDAFTGDALLIYRSHQHQVISAAWSYNGRLIASGDYKGNIHVWEIAPATGRTILHYHDSAGAVKALNWAPRSLQLASGVKSIQVWNIGTAIPDTPEFVYTGHSSWINALQWSPDGQTIASASDDKTVQVWKVST